MNAISFCLFGQQPMYLEGAIRNADLAPKFYPGWKLMFWVGYGVPIDTRKALTDRGADLVDCTDNPMIARFLVADESTVDRFVVRDTDSRLNQRERDAVQQWEDSGWPFHVIRDHPGHRVAMPGGLWGGVRGHFKMESLIRDWTGPKNAGARNSIYNNDQVFLRQCVWPRIKDACLQHDFCSRNLFRAAREFPAKLGDWRFCGEIFDHQDQPERYGWQKRLNWMTA